MMAYCRWTKNIEGNPPKGQQLVLFIDRLNKNYAKAEDGQPWQTGVGYFSTATKKWCVYSTSGSQVKGAEVLYYTDAEEFTETMQGVIEYDSAKEDLRELMKDAKVTYHYDWRFWTYMSKREIIETIILIVLLIGNLVLLAAYFLIGFGAS